MTLRVVLGTAVLFGFLAVFGWLQEAERQQIYISEVSARNQTHLVKDNGASPDWFELHNPSSTPVDLTGWRVRRLGGTTTDWTLPTLTLKPDAYLVVTADRSGDAMSSGFRLSGSGDELQLYDSQGQLCDQIRFGRATTLNHGDHVLKTGNGAGSFLIWTILWVWVIRLWITTRCCIL